MDARLLARLIAAGRVAIGAGFALVPQLTAPLWLGRLGAKPGAQFFCRIVGSRDLVLGAGALAALGGRGRARDWVLAGAVADAFDLAATLAVREQLPPLAAANAIATAAGAAVLGAAAAATLE